MWRLVLALLVLTVLAALYALWWRPAVPAAVPDVPSSRLPELSPPAPPGAITTAIRFTDLWDGRPAPRVAVVWSASDGSEAVESRVANTSATGRLHLRDLQPGTSVTIVRVEEPWMLVTRRADEPPAARRVVRRVDVQLELRRKADDAPATLASVELTLPDGSAGPGDPQWYATLEATLEPDGRGRAVGRVPRVPGGQLHVRTTAGERGTVRVAPDVGEWNDDGWTWAVVCVVE